MHGAVACLGTLCRNKIQGQPNRNLAGFSTTVIPGATMVLAFHAFALTPQLVDRSD